ncbi:hypothetical protein [Marinifilum flexuosum]|uniref:Uncharacterized protein n=2 Tax=Marinifilum flexuosum TaxID=1117708 RepID=A0A419X847_9BACT|nr:hypothetical protein [Marinifilum flexuosum]RKE03911.1 hypothetical protein BXY64_0922 [Marinifilum flexuosum]
MYNGIKKDGNNNKSITNKIGGMETMDFPFNFDEMPIAAKFISDSFSRDIEDFQRVYPVFDDVFKARFAEQIRKAKDIVCCGPEGVKIQNIRIGVFRKIESLNTLILEAQDYFPISRIKQFDYIVEIIEKKNLSSILSIVPNLLQQLEANVPTQNEDVAQSIIDGIQSIYQVLKLDRIELNRLLNSRGLLKEEVFRCLNHLWATMQDVMEIGQSLYRKDDPMKCVEYELNYIKMKVKTFWMHSVPDKVV